MKNTSELLSDHPTERMKDDIEAREIFHKKLDEFFYCENTTLEDLIKSFHIFTSINHIK